MHISLLTTSFEAKTPDFPEGFARSRPSRRLLRAESCRNHFWTRFWILDLHLKLPPSNLSSLGFKASPPNFEVHQAYDLGKQQQVKSPGPARDLNALELSSTVIL